ncbi:uncharacterized protein LOC126815659 isoform X2 [Patella vulgata]|uniref:uncharacterized protein LOC126815659 isoform X2 n=1 Tax=Patella vulgata TaxID=6465 RepID=UPI00217F6EB0|nr:uncharacterized protein LOC126815659 isoform X2 [Patella vulgata]
MASTNKKSANQFISALVKNLQAVCHGHVEFDKNVKVVGHLYLTVDSNSEFNYIVNEKVSKSDESSTTFISKSFYATDLQQKTPKKNVDRPLPLITPNVLGKTRYDITVDLTNEFASTDKRQSVPYVISQNQSLGPQRRKSQNDVQYPPLGKRQRLSPNEQKSVNFQLPRKMSSRSSSTIPSTSVSVETINNAASRPTATPSATPIESLPGTDKPETIDSAVGGMLDPKSIKIENKVTQEGEEKELRIESVTSHDLSFVPETEKDKDSESKNSETSDSDKPASDPPPETLSTEEMELITPNRSPPKSNEHEVIEIDLTKVKEEFRDFGDSESNSMFDSSVNHGEASYSGVGIETNDDDEFFKRLQEQAVGIYPLGLHANESNIQNSNLDTSIPNLPGVSLRQTRNLSAGTSSSSAGSQPDFFGLNNKLQCLWCGQIFNVSTELTKHELSNHGIYNPTSRRLHYQCPYCTQVCSSKGSVKEHISIIHMNFRVNCPLCDKSYTRKIDLRYHITRQHSPSLGIIKTGVRPLTNLRHSDG